jgi:ABC-type uncharacterized transport system substrate-binding protein
MRLLRARAAQRPGQAPRLRDVARRFAAACATACAATSCASPATLVVVLHGRSEPTLEACVHALERELEREFEESRVVVERVVVEAADPALAARLRAVDERAPAVVVACGTPLVSAACRALRAPLVAAYCYDPRVAGVGRRELELEGAAGATGVGSPPPLAAVAALLRELAAPHARIGVVVDESEAGPAAQARRLRDLLQQGPHPLELVQANLERDAPVPQSLERAVAELVERHGVVAAWKVGDATLVHQVPAYAAAWRARGVPWVGDHPTHLALGASAVAWIDFEEAGRRAGRLAARVAAGTSPRGLPVEMLDEGRVARSTTARRR